MIIDLVYFTNRIIDLVYFTDMIIDLVYFTDRIIYSRRFRTRDIVILVLSMFSIYKKMKL